MSTNKLCNVPLKEFRFFLSKVGCNYSGTEGGHEKWTRKDLTRPIIVQTHASPIPEFIIRNALRNLNLTKIDFFNILFDIKEKDNPNISPKTNEPIMRDEELCYCGSGKKYFVCCGRKKD